MKGRDVPPGVPICSHEKFLLGRNLNASWSELRMYVDDQYKWGDFFFLCFLWYKDSELQVYGLQLQREIQALWRGILNNEFWTPSLLVEASIYRGFSPRLGP